MATIKEIQDRIKSVNDTTFALQNGSNDYDHRV